jgi:diaminohydroxyphosphoribosylaminopyrimidine deaminase/5-amino-6-(5-phosphoribosylamino)uracil reductase
MSTGMTSNKNLTKDDEKWMRRVLHLAEKGRGRTSPNPMVGAILVKRGRLVGEGYHARAGERHAEIAALTNAGEKARGATLYLNLEPCTHYGKTPPCVPAVIKAGVRKVVVGIEDPNPLVKGRGVARLMEAGLDVKVGVLEKECHTINEAFRKYIVQHEPFVILKVAATLDGKLATRTGESQWITGETSRRFVHRLRDEVDGVVVGIGTVLRDDPLLTARIRGGRDPYRIVFDSRLRIPENAKMVDLSPSKTIVATTEMASRDKIERLRKRGVRMLISDSESGKVNLQFVLQKLAEMGMMSLLLEGGSQLSGSFLDQRLIDKILLFLSPKLIGDPLAPGIFSGAGVSSLKETIPVKDLKVRKIGDDILVEGYLEKFGVKN